MYTVVSVTRYIYYIEFFRREPLGSLLNILQQNELKDATKQNGMDRLPFDVVINHILPFTYQVQPKPLLADIRSFVKTIERIKDKYTFDYNYYILLVDLICYCNKEELASFMMNYEFSDIIKRNIKYRHFSNVRMEYLVYLNLLDNIHEHTMRKIRFLWGLLTPQERILFENRTF